MLTGWFGFSLIKKAAAKPAVAGPVFWLYVGVDTGKKMKKTLDYWKINLRFTPALRTNVAPDQCCSCLGRSGIDDPN